MTFSRISIVGLILIVLGFSEVGFAKGFGKVAVTYTSHTSTDGGVADKTTRMIYDVGLYYKFPDGGWVLGALYQNDNVSSSASADRTSYGVSGGWMAPRDSGFFLLGTYFVSSKYGDMTDGSGYQIDLGYKFTPQILPIFMQISYKQYDYSKFDHSDTYIDPYFGFVVLF